MTFALPRRLCRPTSTSATPAGTQFEKFQSIKADAIKTCPQCGQGVGPRRLISAGAGFIFKGSGFYITDYREKGYADQAKADKAAGEPPKADKPAEGAPATPAAATTETKSTVSHPVRSHPCFGSRGVSPGRQVRRRVTSGGSSRVDRRA